MGAALGFAYLVLPFTLSFFSLLDTFLGWVWLFVSGPGLLAVSLLPFHLPPRLHYDLGWGVTALFYFTAGATTAYAVRFRWLILTTWVIVSAASAILGLAFTFARLIEPIP